MGLGVIGALAGFTGPRLGGQVVTALAGVLSLVAGGFLLFALSSGTSQAHGHSRLITYGLGDDWRVRAGELATTRWTTSARVAAATTR
jgi:hypothetical protein